MEKMRTGVWYIYTQDWYWYKRGMGYIIYYSLKELTFPSQD